MNVEGQLSTTRTHLAKGDIELGDLEMVEAVREFEEN
jgi:hypothetical protein